MNLLRIATRSSKLAIAQTRLVAQLLEQAHPGLRIELVTLSTRGDRTSGPLTEIGGKGLFTTELEEAMRDGRAHLAVHSAKDLPLELPGDMQIASCPVRADARDALVSRSGEPLAELPPGSRIGTSSLRRIAQAMAVRPDLLFVPLRGNVETRVRKVMDGELDAAVLAMAGLERSGLMAEHAAHVHPFPAEEFVPAAGQGILALEVLTEGTMVQQVVAAIDDPASRSALQAERAVTRALGADCNSPVGVNVFLREGQWSAAAMVASPGDLSRMVRCVEHGLSSPEVAQAIILEQLWRQGAQPLLERPR